MPPRKISPAELDFLAIYNPSLGTTDDTLENQIVYYSSPKRDSIDNPPIAETSKARSALIHERENEQLRQIGLAQGMVEFGRTFSGGKSVEAVETEKSRIVLHELESGWWILAVGIHCYNVGMNLLLIDIVNKPDSLACYRYFCRLQLWIHVRPGRIFFAGVETYQNSPCRLASSSCNFFATSCIFLECSICTYKTL